MPLAVCPLSTYTLQSTAVEPNRVCGTSGFHVTFNSMAGVAVRPTQRKSCVVTEARISQASPSALAPGPPSSILFHIHFNSAELLIEMLTQFQRMYFNKEFYRRKIKSVKRGKRARASAQRHNTYLIFMRLWVCSPE